MSKGWKDVLNIASIVVGAVSLLATVVGLLYAIAQIRKTKSAAAAALEESRQSYHRFAAGNAHRFIKEARIHVENKQWTLAASQTKWHS
jgi:hypothetical protein